MFTRHLIAASALMVASLAAHADVISTSPGALASDMSVVDANTALSGAGTGLAAILASSNSSAQLYLVRGVEGLYMLASRAIPQAGAAPALELPTVTSPALVDVPAVAPVAAPEATPATPVAAIDPALVPVADADPVVLLPLAGEVPEPGSMALLLAGLLGAAGFMRSRKQG